MWCVYGLSEWHATLKFNLQQLVQRIASIYRFPPCKILLTMRNPKSTNPTWCIYAKQWTRAKKLSTLLKETNANKEIDDTRVCTRSPVFKRVFLFTYLANEIEFSGCPSLEKHPQWCDALCLRILSLQSFKWKKFFLDEKQVQEHQSFERKMTNNSHKTPLTWVQRMKFKVIQEHREM